MIWTPKQYSDEIEALTALIHESGITPVLFEAAEQRDLYEMKTFVKQLTEAHPKLWEMMVTFYVKYYADDCPYIFYDKDDKDDGYFARFPKGIDLKSFVMLLMLSDGRVSDTTLFGYPNDLTLKLREQGLEKLADYQNENAICDLNSLVQFAHGNY